MDLFLLTKKYYSHDLYITFIKHDFYLHKNAFINIISYISLESCHYQSYKKSFPIWIFTYQKIYLWKSGMEPQKYACGNLGWYPKKCIRGILGWYPKKCTRENLCWYPIENLGWYPIIYICGNLGETGPKAQRWTFWLIWCGQHSCGHFGSRTLGGARAVGFSGDTPVHGRIKRFRGHGRVTS